MIHRLFCREDKLKKGGLSPTAFSVNLLFLFSAELSEKEEVSIEQ